MPEDSYSVLKSVKAKKMLWLIYPPSHKALAENSAVAQDLGWFIRPSTRLWRKIDLRDVTQ